MSGSSVDEDGLGSSEGESLVPGVVVEVLPRALFRVQLESREHITAHLSREPRRNFVRILMGDRVRVSRSPRDRTRGRITAKLP